MTENEIEQLAIDLLKSQGYEYINGPEIALDGASAERLSFEKVVLKDRLESAVRRINTDIPIDVQQDVIKEVLQTKDSLLINSEGESLNFKRVYNKNMVGNKRKQFKKLFQSRFVMF